MNAASRDKTEPDIQEYLTSRPQLGNQSEQRGMKHVDLNENMVRAMARQRRPNGTAFQSYHATGDLSVRVLVLAAQALHANRRRSVAICRRWRHYGDGKTTMCSRCR